MPHENGQLTAEELEPTEQQLQDGRALVADGWQSIVFQGLVTLQNGNALKDMDVYVAKEDARLRPEELPEIAPDQEKYR